MTITEFLEARIAEDEARATYVHEYGDTGGLFSTARVLAEGVAKRQLIAMFGYGQEVWDGTRWVGPLAVLAAVYSGHPDYRQEWA